MNTVDIKALNERIQQESSFVDMISMEMTEALGRRTDDRYAF